MNVPLVRLFVAVFCFLGIAADTRCFGAENVYHHSEQRLQLSS